MPYTHIAFDIDGTLISSEYANMKALQDTLLKFRGFAPSMEELLPYFGLPGMDALAHLGVTDREVIYPYWAEHVHDYDDTIRPYDGVLEMLAKLRDMGFALGVVSSKKRAEYIRGFQPMPVSAFFTVQVLEEDTKTHKPGPEPLLRYLELTGARPENVLYVGDREGDLKCARGAGMEFAFARWGNPDGEMDADYDLKTPADLVTLLEKK